MELEGSSASEIVAKLEIINDSSQGLQESMNTFGSVVKHQMVGKLKGFLQ